MADERLLRVMSCRGAVELLDELEGGPRQFAELRRVIPRRVLVSALRALAAESALRCNAAGSWDERPPGDALFLLTATGRRLLRNLSDLDEWVAVYDDYFNG